MLLRVRVTLTTYLRYDIGELIGRDLKNAEISHCWLDESILFMGETNEKR